MSWFEEQIKERKRQDSELFEGSMENLADAVTGRRRKGDMAEIGNDEIKKILRSYGFHSRAEVPKDVVEFNDRLAYLCRPYGLMYRRIRLTEGWYKDSVGAVLGFRRDDGSAVALLPDAFGYYYLEGENKIRIKKSNCDEISEAGYCFYKPLPNRRINLFDLTKYAIFTRSIRDIVLIVGFMAISTLIGLLSPKLSYFLYSTVVESGSNRLLFSTVVFILSVSISSMLFSGFQGLYNGIISTKMNIALKAATMMRILSLPPSFFRKYSSGELSERSGYLGTLAQNMVSVIFGTGLSSLFSLAYISSIFKYAPGLVIPSIIIILATVTFSMVVMFTRQRISKETMEMSTKESGMTYSMISGVKKIRIAGAEKRAFARWANLFSKSVQKSYNPPKFIRINGAISLAISSVGTLVIYYYSIKTGIDMAEYTAFNAAYGMVFGAFSSIVSLASTYSNIKPILEMAKPLMDCEPEAAENREILSKVNGQIEFNNVTFAYEENTPTVVDDMSFKILPGQYIGIVGKTGCGKSTLIRLLLGFEKPQKGSVYYDGKDLGSLDLKSLRRKIGVVMQDGKLFQGDIFSNITISAPWLTLDDAWDAAELAGIADDIAAMPMGMNTLISEGSGGISGGQRQRLIIARAIAPKPKILIFDEATSALDNVTQKKVSDALDTLDCTRIVIAHRLSTVRHCDRILYLGDGKILEDGTYDELIAKKGLFYELVERQRIEA